MSVDDQPDPDAHDVPERADTPGRPDDEAGVPADHRLAEVVRERHVDASPARVWEVIADRGRRRDFLGGDLDVDLEPGSTGRFDGPDGTVPARVRRVRPRRHLQFDWGDGDDATSVDIHLDPSHDGTHVTIRERALPAAPMARAHLRAGTRRDDLLALAA